MIVVSDTSPVRALGHLGCLLLLEEFFGEVLIPPAVQRELQNPPAQLPRIDCRQYSFFRVQDPQDQAQVSRFLQTLDPGESEALALAMEQHADAVLIDEAAGRAAAASVGLAVVGTLGVLLRAKQQMHVLAVRPLVDRLRDELGFFISPELQAEILRRAGE